MKKNKVDRYGIKSEEVLRRENGKRSILKEGQRTEFQAIVDDEEESAAARILQGRKELRTGQGGEGKFTDQVQGLVSRDGT